MIGWLQGCCSVTLAPSSKANVAFPTLLGPNFLRYVNSWNRQRLGSFDPSEVTFKAEKPRESMVVSKTGNL